jgi:5-methylcytosine-specific restriction endonuclease McrA
VQDIRVRENKIRRQERMRLARRRGTHTMEEWLALIVACGDRCVCCGATDRNLEKDHIVPVYQGGSDGIDNIQPVCATCNCSKGSDSTDHRPPDWRSKIVAPA